MNENVVFDSLVTQTWQVAVVGCVVWLVVRWFASDRPHLAHALWVLVLLKCVTPPLWSSPVSPFSWWNSETIHSTPVDSHSLIGNVKRPGVLIQTIGQANNVSDFEFKSPSTSKPVAIWRLPTIPTLCVAVWMLGMFASCLIVIFRWLRLSHLIRHREILSPSELQSEVCELATSLGISKHVRVRVVDSPIGPAVAGWLRPSILLPQALVQNKQLHDRQLLLAHELIHIRRGDLWFAVLQAVAQTALWFNPFVWIASNQLQKESERCCDEETIAGLRCPPASYARMLLSVLEAKHRLRVLPALPGVRPVDVTAKRLERIMRLGNGIHTHRPWWTIAILILGAIVVLPGAARVVGQDDAMKPGTTESVQETVAGTEDWNFDKQIVIETKQIQMPTRLLDDLDFDWAEGSNQSEYCVLAPDAQDKLAKILTAETDVAIISMPKVSLFDGQDWLIEQSDQRKFVKSWEPFKGQENMPVRTLSPVTEEVKFGWSMNGTAKCLEASDEVQLSINVERTSIAEVETSMFTYENDIGGEPHPIQLPKNETRQLKADANLAVGESLVFRETEEPGESRLTIVRCAAVVDTPRVEEDGLEEDERQLPRMRNTSPHDTSLSKSADVKEDEPPVANVYVDCGHDFTLEQVKWIASRHDELGFESVQIHEGRLRVLAQELAHVATARRMVESEIPRQLPVIRGSNSDKAIDYSVLIAAMEASSTSCRIEGEVNYTINREQINVQASPLEITYTDEEQRFRLRGDEGEIQTVLGSNDVFMLFEGNVIVELAGWEATADCLEVDDEAWTLRGNIVIERQDGKGQPIMKTGEVRVGLDIESLEELIAEFTKE